MKPLLKKALPFVILAMALIWAIRSAHTPTPAVSSLPSAFSTPAATLTPSPAAKPQAQAQALPAKWHILLDDSLSYQQRLLIAEDIREGISPAEIDFLFAALDHTPPPGTEEQWWVVMNEIMERLRKKGLGADQYSTRLGKIAAESQRSEVARDYAIQHLLQWISPDDSGISPGETDPALRVTTLELVSGIIRDPSLRHSTIPGTALLALADASSRLPLAETAACWDALDSFLAPLVAGGSDASLGLHISAIQAAALTGRVAHLPAIHRLASDAAADPSLRLTSIAALGIYGAEDQRAFLTSLSQKNDRFSYAATAALVRLDQHLAENAK